MKEKNRKAKNKIYGRSIIIIFIVVIMLLLGISCKKNKNKILHFEYDPETMPTMITKDVITLISDSGITRYKLKADLWKVYDRAKEPYWFFPKGIYLERFDKEFSIEATVKADTAWSYRDKNLWQLKGNVEVENIEGDHFASEELFWDEKNDRVYSNKYIEIKTADAESKGYGFESNQKMTEYRIFRPHDGRIPFSEGFNPTDSISATAVEDSTKANIKRKSSVTKDTLEYSTMKPIQGR